VSIHVILDTSGSMSSMSKMDVVCALVKFCADISVVQKNIFFELNFNFYLFGNSSELVLYDSKKVPGLKSADLKINGRPELVIISKLLEKTGREERNFLFLSDGRFSGDDVSKFLHIAENYPDMRFVSVAVGADADEFTLKKISAGNNVFRPQDIMQAIETFFSGGGKCPVSCSSIDFSVSDSGGEDWDA